MISAASESLLGLKIINPAMARMPAASQPIEIQMARLDGYGGWGEIYRANIGRLVERGSFTPPARAFPGARYMAPAESADEAGWEQVRGLWPAPEEE